MTESTHTHAAEEERHAAEEERQGEERRPSAAHAAPPLSPPLDKYDFARGREQLERVLAK